jgi:hypothetical protein
MNHLTYVRYFEKYVSNASEVLLSAPARGRFALRSHEMLRCIHALEFQKYSGIWRVVRGARVRVSEMRSPSPAALQV